MCTHIHEFILIVEFLKVSAIEVVHEVKGPVSKSDDFSSISGTFTGDSRQGLYL